VIFKIVNVRKSGLIMSHCASTKDGIEMKIDFAQIRLDGNTFRDE